jgi:hypothetical protein
MTNSNFDIASEILAAEELASITGYKTPSKQIAWLASHGWHYTLSGAQRPIVGRVYTRLKLAGVRPSAANATSESWSLDLSKVS